MLPKPRLRRALATTAERPPAAGREFGGGAHVEKVSATEQFEFGWRNHRQGLKFQALERGQVAGHVVYPHVAESVA